MKGKRHSSATLLLPTVDVALTTQSWPKQKVKKWNRIRTARRHFISENYLKI